MSLQDLMMQVGAASPTGAGSYIAARPNIRNAANVQHTWMQDQAQNPFSICPQGYYWQFVETANGFNDQLPGWPLHHNTMLHLSQMPQSVIDAVLSDFPNTSLSTNLKVFFDPSAPNNIAVKIADGFYLLFECFYGTYFRNSKTQGQGGGAGGSVNNRNNAQYLSGPQEKAIARYAANAQQQQRFVIDPNGILPQNSYQYRRPQLWQGTGNAPGTGDQSVQAADALAGYIAANGCDGSQALTNAVMLFQQQDGSLPITGVFDAATATALATYNEQTFPACSSTNTKPASAYLKPVLIGAGVLVAGYIGYKLLTKKGRRR